MAQDTAHQPTEAPPSDELYLGPTIDETGELQTASDREVNQREVELIRLNRSNDPTIGYNRWPKAR